MFFEIAIVLLLTIVNGVLAMSELAIVSSRPARLRVLVEQGNRGAATALRLLEDPGSFLSAVQIGITLVGVLSGAFSGATLGGRVAVWLADAGVAQSLANTLGVGSVVVVITYLSLILGELVPKQIALRATEQVAARVAPLMAGISFFTAPLVWLLNNSGKLVLAMLGQSGVSDSQMSDAEIKMTIDEAQSAGVLKHGEREMIAGVMRVADRTARALMTQRRDVELLDLTAPRPDVLAQARATRRGWLPVRDGDADDIIGVISVKELLMSWEADPDVDLRTLVQQAPIVIDVAGAAQVIGKLRETRVRMVLVFDEYGHFEGLITPLDVLGAITGAFADNADDEPDFVQRADGSFLVSGWMPVDEFAERMGIAIADERDYDTVAGFVLERLGHIPAVGEVFGYGPLRVEVVDLDGLRIDKLLVSRAA